MNINVFNFSLFSFSIVSACFNDFDKDEIAECVSVENLTLSVYEKGSQNIIKRLNFNNNEKKKLLSWFRTLTDLSTDYITYAPILVLDGEKLQINFLETTTVISVKNNTQPSEGWKQYSRPATKYDKNIKNWLLSKI